jgi:SWI/SNF-related matrix-associated actin-dependent regulator of chromatin subfamily A3
LLSIDNLTNLCEAHVIRNWLTKQFRAICAIPAHIRWCLSGTPIQNNLEDLGALVKFLKVPLLDEMATFRRHISRHANGIFNNSTQEVENLRLLLGVICLRRKRTVLCLLEPKIEEKLVDLTVDERMQYDGLHIGFQRAIDYATNHKRSKEKHQTVLEALLSLRLFCNHGLKSGSETNNLISYESERLLSLLQQTDGAQCGYCFCDIQEIWGRNNQDAAQITVCYRLVCRDCSDQYRKDLIAAGRTVEPKCPLCGISHTLHRDSSAGNDTHANGFVSVMPTYPTKLQVLLRDIRTHYTTDKRYINRLCSDCPTVHPRIILI